MKKFYILMVAVILVATSCNKKSKDLIYNGENPITIALLDTTQLSIDSDYDVTLTSSDNNCATVLNGGKECYMYHNKVDSSIGCGKIANVNQWKEFCLYYFGL